MGTAGARPLQTLTAIPKARPVRGFKPQGNDDLQNLPVHELHFHVSGCTGTFGGESVGFRQEAVV